MTNNTPEELKAGGVYNQPNRGLQSIAEKKTFYRVICEEFSGGLLYELRGDALEQSQELRSCGEKGVYVRKVKMTLAEFEEYPEV